MNSMSTTEKLILRKISRGFQITLPSKFCQQTGLTVGDQIRIEQEDDRLIITPVYSRRQQLARELTAALSEPVEGGDFVDEEEALCFAIDQVRQACSERKKKTPQPT